MAPLITLYILGGCVAVAAILFIVMIVFSALRPPRLPDMPLVAQAPLQRMIRALTPVPLAPATAGPPIDSMFDDEEKTIPARPKNAIALVVGAPAARTATPPALPGVAPRPPSPPSLPGVLSRSAMTEFEAPRAVKPPRPPAPPAPPARTTPPPPPVAAKSAPTPPAAPTRPMPASFATAPALMPSRWSQEATSPGSFASTPSSASMRRLPVYPAHTGRTVARFFGGVAAFVVLASAIVIAKPGLLDPVCDELEWFGDDTAMVLRDHARDANAAATPYLEALLAPALTDSN